MSADNEFRRPTGFRSLISSRAWAELVQQGVRIQYRARENLIAQGAPGGWVLLCLSGRLKVVYSRADGREVLLAIRGPGDVIGEFSGRDGQPRSATVQAIDPVIAYKLPDQRFNTLVQRFQLGTQLNSYLLGKMRESATYAWQLAHRTTAVRLADLLITLIDAAGPDHPCPATIALSQEELATALGLARSAVTPVLAEWKAAGLICVSRGKLHVADVATLERISRPDVSTSGQNGP
ncbi:cAMP-binding domain of CRP or a regulatory subunit of cAMP-dependent protein kinases [Actinopolyspora saharensis]|uniref:cAMP-binding domain of CRP or a regulatory subunit of cAMP-dependent protein kinases n=1 Tax=Actinopolyspora saharensis TaxID=995062 RepID=A0A1H0Z4Q5_9ACTN|nr:Crp/Fnr family transcriptional regulator [Actinopolyspora saharensis]SDQ22066.1 cAMP-binding domain of CRP or a regulatory subunit of cAMP-dependent protein kinases [Actinopolyspora saharensis]